MSSQDTTERLRPVPRDELMTRIAELEMRIVELESELREPRARMRAMQMTQDMRLLLVEILTDTECLGKVSVRVDAVSRSITVVYEDLDDEWFREVSELMELPDIGRGEG